MCKNRQDQTRIIEDAKRNADEVFALFERTDYGDDLVGIVEVLNDVVVKLYELDGNRLKLHSTVAHDFRTTKGNVLKALHICDRNEPLWGMYRLRTC